MSTFLPFKLSNYLMYGKKGNELYLEEIIWGRRISLNGKISKKFQSLIESKMKLKTFVELYPIFSKKLIENKIFIPNNFNNEILKYPLQIIEIELSSLCNSNCTICPREKIKRPLKLMTNKTMDSIFKNLTLINPSIKQIYFAGLGEPLLNNKIFLFSKKIKKIFPNLIITLISNADLLTREFSNMLIKSPINIFSCSFQGITNEEYNRNMNGLIFEKSLRNVKYLNKINLAKSNLKIVVTQTLENINPGYFKKYFNFWKDNGIEAYINPIHNRGGFLYTEKIKNNKNFFRHRCDILNSRTFISASGNILACCHDLDGKTNFGNINEESLSIILKRKFETIKKGILFNICKKCNDGTADVAQKIK